MKKLLLTGLAAIIFATANVGAALAEENKGVKCMSHHRVASLARKIPKYFKEIRHNVYLIDFVPEAKQGYTYGGQLTVLIDDTPNELSIFDRRNTDHKKWYNITNSDNDETMAGCVNQHGIPYLNAENGTSIVEAQEKFNAFIEAVENKIKGYNGEQ